MKYSIVGIFGVFVLFVTLVFSGSKLYAQGSEKESGWAIGADNKNIICRSLDTYPRKLSGQERRRRKDAQ